MREELEALLEGLNVFLISEEVSQSTSAFNVLFLGQPKEKEAGKNQLFVDGGAAPEKVIVGRYAELKNRFYNKNVPPFSEKFLLDLEYEYSSRVCTIHYLNLPANFRGRGVGAQVVKKVEELAKRLGMRAIAVPAEHNAVAFWLRQGYCFKQVQESEFFHRHKNRKDLFIAYDLRKNCE